MARLPSATTADKPPFDPTGASFDSRIGSPLKTDARKTRESRSAGFANAPFGMEPEGHSTALSMAGVRRLPRSMSDPATTSLLAEPVACWESQRAPIMTAPRPAITAATIMISALVFLIVRILYKAVAGASSVVCVVCVQRPGEVLEAA